MDIIFAFFIFAAAMLATLLTDSPMLLPLLLGFLCFFAVALRRGHPFGAVGRMALRGAKDSMVVIYVLLLIGLITALWRSAGTITFFVYYGIQIITPAMFIFITFLLACLLSYALGTSFGVAGTVGVIFMALARSGGVNELVAAGAVMSGVYFGDRGSPASSSANLVAAVTRTTLYNNTKVMMKTGLLPTALAAAVYLVLSLQNPITHVDQGILRALGQEFHISLWLALPAVFMLVLPLFRVNVFLSLGISILSALGVTIGMQDIGLLQALRYAILGYTAQNQSLSTILNGGGVVSMLEVCGIVLLSCSYSGIFSGTGMLQGIQDGLEQVVRKVGTFPAMILTSIGTTCIFCNQTVASIMCSDLMGKFYPFQETPCGEEKTELAIDIENSVIVLSGLIPWAIASTVPLAMLGVGMSALPYAALLYLIPLCYLFTKKIWYKDPPKILPRKTPESIVKYPQNKKGKDIPMKLTFVTIHVTDLDASIRFYEEIIGMKTLRRFPAGPKQEIAFLEAEGGAQIELIAYQDKKEITHDSHMTLGFPVEDVDATIEALAQKGIPIAGGPFRPNSQTKFFFITDPNGVTLELIESH